MALSAAQVTWIQKLSNLSSQQLQNNQVAAEAAVLFDSSGGWSSTIVQADLDGSKFSGLKLSDLLAAKGAIVGAISTGISGNAAFLTQLAAAGGN